MSNNSHRYALTAAEAMLVGLLTATVLCFVFRMIISIAGCVDPALAQ